MPTRSVLALILLVTATAGCATVATKLKKKERTRAQVTVLYVADLHAQLREHPELFWSGGRERTELAGGFARVAAAIAQIREERGGEVLVLDAGDTLQGSGAAALTEGKALIEPLNLLGLDAAIPGNWEVVYGANALRDRADELDYPLFAANLRDGATGERVFPPRFLKKVAGVNVAVVGYTDPDVPRRQPPGYSAGLRYQGDEELQTLVDDARENDGAEVVLLLSHIGLAKAVALAGKVKGVDAHLSGDTHERTYEPIEQSGSWVVEPGAFGSFLGRLDLWVENGRVVDRRWELIELTAARFPEAPAVKSAVEQALAPLEARLGRVVGQTPTELARYAVVENALDNLLADALRVAGGTQIALSNGFRFGTPWMPGPITEADLWNVYPIVNRLKTGKVKGSQLKAFFEQELENVFAEDPERRFGGWLPRASGLSLEFDAFAEKGRRIVRLEVGGHPVRDDEIYTVTACEREGDAPDMLCRIPNVRDARVLDIDAHEAVRNYLASSPHVSGKLDGRAVGRDLPRVLRTQQLSSSATPRNRKVRTP